MLPAPLHMLYRYHCSERLLDDFAENPIFAGVSELLFVRKRLVSAFLWELFRVRIKEEFGYQFAEV